MVWFAVTLVKEYDVRAPTDVPSTVTFWTLYPHLGVIVKLRLPPELTLTFPNGEMVPPVPAEAVIVYVLVVEVNVALIVWLAVTLVKE